MGLGFTLQGWVRRTLHWRGSPTYKIYISIYIYIIKKKKFLASTFCQTNGHLELDASQKQLK
jgi:hypothetical protein